MSRLTHAWRAMEGEQRLAAVAALSLLVTMFFPWYGLQSLNRRTGVIYSHDISAFGDVSFVEAAVFLVAAGVIAIVLARAEGRDFHLPGGDGTIVMIAGGWAALLIFYRVFDRPSGGGYPVGIEWGFFLAFVAAGALAFAGWRMRAGERPEPPLTRRRTPHREPPSPGREPPPPGREPPSFGSEPRSPGREPPSLAREPAGPDGEPTVLAAAPPRRRRTEPVPARERSRYPPAPAEQLSFEDPPARSEP